MTERTKRLRIGKLCNKIATALFVLFFIDTCVYAYNEQKIFYNIQIVIIAILFAICSITSHILLKDYKPE